MLSLRQAWVATALVGGLLGGAAIAEAARPVEAFRWHDEADFITTRCGVDIRLEFSEGGNVVGRMPGKDGLPRYTATWRGESTWTNLATGRAYTFKWSVVDHDASVVDNGDGTLTVLTQNAGTESIYGPDGQRLHDLAGLQRAVLSIDNGGTPADPSDDTLINADVVSSSGRPVPTNDFCAEFRALTG